MQGTENFLLVLGKHVHPLFLRVRTSQNLQIRGVAPQIKVYNSET
jgi:hypothetical protein